MNDLFVIAAGSVLGIVGTLAAVWLAHTLDRRSQEHIEAIARQLEHLDEVEAGFKRLCSELLNDILVPTPLGGRGTIAALRALVYLSPVALAPEVVMAVLNVCDQAAKQRTYRSLARRWILGDVEQAQALTEKLAVAEAAVATAITSRRRELIGETSRRWRLWPRLNPAPSANVAGSTVGT